MALVHVHKSLTHSHIRFITLTGRHTNNSTTNTFQSHRVQLHNHRKALCCSSPALNTQHSPSFFASTVRRSSCVCARAKERHKARANCSSRRRHAGYKQKKEIKYNGIRYAKALLINTNLSAVQHRATCGEFAGPAAYAACHAYAHSSQRAKPIYGEYLHVHYSHFISDDELPIRSKCVCVCVFCTMLQQHTLAHIYLYKYMCATAHRESLLHICSATGALWR